MKYYGTKNNKDYGFYLEPFENSIEITDDYWIELLTMQNEGKIIIPYKNNVIAVDENQYSQINGVWEKLSREESAAKHLSLQNNIKKQEIQIQMKELDKKRIRAIAEPSLKDENITWLEYYNSQITELRNELSQLNE